VDKVYIRGRKGETIKSRYIGDGKQKIMIRKTPHTDIITQEMSL
jgi:hypothetical protein